MNEFYQSRVQQRGAVKHDKRYISYLNVYAASDQPSGSLGTLKPNSNNCECSYSCYGRSNLKKAPNVIAARMLIICVMMHDDDARVNSAAGHH
jgi:hypothetical protein